MQILVVLLHMTNVIWNFDKFTHAHMLGSESYLSQGCELLNNFNNKAHHCWIFYAAESNWSLSDIIESTVDKNKEERKTYWKEDWRISCQFSLLIEMRLLTLTMDVSSSKGRNTFLLNLKKDWILHAIFTSKQPIPGYIQSNIRYIILSWQQDIE